MIKQLLSLSLFGFLSLFLYSQEEELLNAYTIPSELKTHANAIVRYDDIDIDILAYNKMHFNQKRIVTVLNREGDTDLDAIYHYDKNIDIKQLEARIYNEAGNEIKKIKKSDFKDVSAVGGGTLYSDNRVKYLDYTPIDYPYTMVLDAKIEYKSTAFIPVWRPLGGYYVSTQFSDYLITNTSGVEIKVKTSNFENYNIEKPYDFHYSAKHLRAIQPEEYRPNFFNYAPLLRVALTKFDMEGVQGVNNNWEDFGKWMYDELLTGTDRIPENVKIEIRHLTEGVNDKLERAKIVYQYMQNKTRYISVQVGIGGWKPMLASDVDRLGYADCKGLSNYTKALLHEVGVEAFYTVIYGDNNIRNIDREFSAVQGNHVILSIPNGDENVWLECTSQTNPFGFIAGFTDDRDVLLITSEGGKIKHTRSYSKDENLQLTKANVELKADGSIIGEVNIKTYGYQYALHDYIERKTAREQELYYKETYWDYINNLSIDAMEIVNDKDSIVFTENIKLSAQNYATKSGNRLLFQPNVFNKVTNTPTRYKNRMLDFEIERGFTDKDEFTVQLDSNLEIEAMPNDVAIETKFGSYNFSIKILSDNQLLYKRIYVLNKGYYSKEEYETFREFILNVAKYDNTKIVLLTKT
jgi:hypothetical protein